MITFITFTITLMIMLAVFILAGQTALKFGLRLIKYLNDSTKPGINRAAIILVPLMFTAYYLIENSNNTELLILFIAACLLITAYCFYKFFELRKSA